MSPQTFNAIFDIFSVIGGIGAVGVAGAFVVSIVESYRHK